MIMEKKNRMEIIDNYDSYLSLFKAGKTDAVFSGEWSVMKIVGKYKPQGIFYVWDMQDDNKRAILMKVDVAQDSLRITEAYELGFSPYKIAENLGITEADMGSAIKWWNLCYYRDQEGNVIYDEYYDTLFAANNTEKTMNDFREELQKHIVTIPKEIENCEMYLLGNFSAFNPLIYELQKLKCKVTMLSETEINESDNLEEQLLQLKDEMVIPYCNGEVYKMNRITSEGAVEVLAKCKHVYCISLPCESLDLDAKFVGNYTLKKILPNGEICKDYKCCGHEFMYLEHTFYADLFGNTILKSVNSEDKDSKLLLHEFTINRS